MKKATQQELYQQRLVHQLVAKMTAELQTASNKAYDSFTDSLNFIIDYSFTEYSLAIFIDGDATGTAACNKLSSIEDSSYLHIQNLSKNKMSEKRRRSETILKEIEELEPDEKRTIYYALRSPLIVCDQCSGDFEAEREYEVHNTVHVHPVPTRCKVCHKNKSSHGLCKSCVKKEFPDGSHVICDSCHGTYCADHWKSLSHKNTCVNSWCDNQLCPNCKYSMCEECAHNESN